MPTRRFRLFSIALAVAGLVCAPDLTRTAAAAPSSDRFGASGYLQDATHNAYTSHGLGASLAPLWTSKLLAGATFGAIDDGRVFVEQDGWVYALRAATGKVLWGVDAGSDAWHGQHLVASKGVLVVGAQADGSVAAYQESSGRPLWRLPARNGVVEPGLANGDAMTPGNGILYVEWDSRKGPSYVEARRLSDGRVLWSARGGDMAADRSHVYLDDYLNNTRHCHVSALTARSGRLLWRRSASCTSEPSDFIPVVGGGRLYDHHGFVRDLKNGAVVGHVHSSVSPIIAGSTLLLVHKRTVVAYSADDPGGAPRWKYTGDTTGSASYKPDVQGPAVAAGGVVYVATAGGEGIQPLSISTGKSRGKLLPAYLIYDFENDPTDAMSVGDGLLLAPVPGGLTAFSSHGRYTGPAASGTRGVSARLAASTTGSTSADNYLQDAMHDGHASGAALGTTISRSWAFDYCCTGTGSTSYPVIAGHRVFVSDTPYVTDVEHQVTTVNALDAATGKPIWQVPLPGSGRWPADLVYGGHRVLALTRAGRLIAMDAGTGHVVYDHELPRPFGAASTWTSPPTIYKGVLYVQVASSKRVPGSNPNPSIVQAIRTSDATTLWQAKRGHDRPEALAVTAGSVYADQCSVVRYRRTDGVRRYTSPPVCASEYHNAAGYHDGVLYRSGFYVDGGAFSASTGNAVRSLAADVEPSFSGKVAFVLSDGDLHAEDIATHRLIWVRQGFVVPPVVVGQRVLDVSVDGELSVLDARTGKTLQRSGGGLVSTYPFDVSNDYSSIAVADGVVVVLLRSTILGFDTT